MLQDGPEDFGEAFRCCVGFAVAGKLTGGVLMTKSLRLQAECTMHPWMWARSMCVPSLPWRMEEVTRVRGGAGVPSGDFAVRDEVSGGS